MKITKETKIGDIIPEGYDLDTTKEVYNGSISIGEVGVGNIMIPIKKKEEKNFEWYIEKYFETNFMFFIRDEYEKPMKEKLLDGYFSVIDFEIRIGLLKFIYEDISKNSNIKLPWLYTLVLVQNYTKHTSRPKIMDICPKEFLDSLFE